MYKFDHKCEKMPEEVSFCHINGCSSSRFTLAKHINNVGFSSTTLYGFRFCPYCGKDVLELEAEVNEKPEYDPFEYEDDWSIVNGY